jgi:hypothetical protein
VSKKQKYTLQGSVGSKIGFFDEEFFFITHGILSISNLLTHATKDCAKNVLLFFKHKM